MGENYDVDALEKIQERFPKVNKKYPKITKVRFNNERKKLSTTNVIKILHAAVIRK